jgi:Coiled-coil protein 142
MCYVVIIVVVLALVCTNPLLEVHINVNVALREKLVSEVKTNRDKVKMTTSECINKVFAYTCEETALATLKIYFPMKIWRVNHLKTTHNQYIDVYLDIIFMPVILATKDLEILSLALKLIGEALLEHIYGKRIKFTVCGAVNLMKDFDGISAWIESCKELAPNYRDKLSKHEVLKVCEGVGKVKGIIFN